MMSPIVAHILPFHGIAGTEIATLRLAQAVRTHGFQSIMFCPGSAVQDMFASEGFRTVLYEQVEPSYRHPKNYWLNSLKLARCFQQERVTLIHCADVMAAEFTSLAALLARKKLVCHVRNRVDTISRRNRSFLAPVSNYVFVSNNTWSTFAIPVRKAKGSVLYDGIDPQPEIGDEQRRALAASFRSEFRIPAARRIVGMVGRLALQKDYATLARASAEVVRKHDACFVIIGDYTAPPQRKVYDETRRLLASLGIDDRFVFTGFRSDVPKLVAAFDVFVLSTHHEGFPLVILEAMADERPVAATAVDGIPEIVAHATTGLLHPPRDHMQLALNIGRYLSDRPFAAKMAAAGKALIAAKFSRALYSEKVGELYRTFISGR